MSTLVFYMAIQSSIQARADSYWQQYVESL